MASLGQTIVGSRGGSMNKQTVISDLCVLVFLGKYVLVLSSLIAFLLHLFGVNQNRPTASVLREVGSGD